MMMMRRCPFKKFHICIVLDFHLNHNAKSPLVVYANKLVADTERENAVFLPVKGEVQPTFC